MFYVHGKFSRNSMKIKEVEAYILTLLHAFLQSCKGICNRCQELDIGWEGRGYLGFQHITLIQKSPAT